MRFETFKAWCLAGAAGMTVGAPTVALAQTSSDDEIVVTAQRRDQRIQDVPVAVTPLSNQFLTDNDIRSLQDLSAIAPGLVATNAVGYGQAPITIRGIGGTNGGGNVFADEPVAIYLDDVYVGRPRFNTSDILDPGSIEVLRGPQGTLFGRNATAGAILVHSATPTSELDGYLRMSANSLNEYRTQGAISGPLAEGLEGRLAVGYLRQEGWGRNATRAEDVPSGEQTSARARLAWDPTQSLHLDLIGEWSEQNTRPALERVFSLATFPFIPAFDRRSDFWTDVDNNRFDHDDPTEYSIDNKGVTLNASWDLGAATLTSVSGWRESQMTGFTDTDGSPLHATANRGVFNDDQYSEELRLVSNGQNTVDWLIGIYYLHENNALDPFTFFVYPASGALFASQKLDSYAAFADATWHASPQWSLSFGGRYSSEERDFVGGVAHLKANGTWHNFSPRGVLQFRASDNAMLYGSYSQAFKSGGFNALALGAPDEFGPEHVKAYEIGLKSDWFDNALRINLSAFHYDYKDLQVRTTPGGVGGVVIENAAEATSQGVEIETRWQATAHWSTTANLSYLDATIDRGLISTVALTIPPSTTSLQNVSGNRLSRAPEWQGYFSARYETPIEGAGTLRFDANYRFQSETFFLEVNQSHNAYRSDAWGELGGRVSYTTANNVEVAIYAQNILDERYVTQVTQLGNLPQAAVNDPAKIGIQLTLRR